MNYLKQAWNNGKNRHGKIKMTVHAFKLTLVFLCDLGKEIRRQKAEEGIQPPGMRFTRKIRGEVQSDNDLSLLRRNFIYCKY